MLTDQALLMLEYCGYIQVLDGGMMAGQRDAMVSQESHRCDQWDDLTVGFRLLHSFTSCTVLLFVVDKRLRDDVKKSGISEDALCQKVFSTSWSG